MRWREALAAGLVLAGLAAAAAVLVARPDGGDARTPSSALSSAAAWNGLVGGPRTPVDTGQRVLVVLSAFSLADRVGRAGGLASDRDEHRWSAAASAAQQQFLTMLGRRGIPVRPDFRFTRTLNAFSAILDPRVIAVLERSPGVKGVYPVRAAFPASLSPVMLRDATAAGPRSGVHLAGVAGRGVTVALLDTGVEIAKAYLHGHVLPGIDIVDDGPDARARAKPTDPAQLERHGTEMAGLLVGAGGPGGLGGVAPAATVLPIRVAGWQADRRGGYTVYARTDQLLAGLECAVDPNHDGDAHDAARIALVPLIEPFAAFSEGPLARAAEGALRLDTLVVAPAGNDGPAGPAFGSVGGPAGAPAVLAVGAVDTRRVTREVRVVARDGLDVFLDRILPLAGAVAPRKTMVLTPAAPSGSAASEDDFFGKGLSLVVGKAAVVPAGSDPSSAARRAAAAGAAAVLLHGRDVAPGGIGLDERIRIPVLSVPEQAARTMLARPGALVALAAPRGTSAGPPRVASFSSWGLAFDGGVKPELVAPGVGLVTTEPGHADDGSAVFGTVNGSSAAAAIVAGAAALLAEARPEADAEILRALLVGGARPLAGAHPLAEGAGRLDLGRSAAAEFVAEPSTLTFGRAPVDGQGRKVLRIRNVSSRRLTVFVATGQGPKPRVPLLVSRSRLEIEPGRAGSVIVSTRPIAVARGEVATGALTITPVGGVPLRVPWAVVLRRAAGLLGALTLSTRSFKPSARKPVVALVRVGRVARTPRGSVVVPVLRLDVELSKADGTRVGLLIRVRDLLPGRYAFGLTGRGPGGRVLAPGRYRLRVFAWPTGGGPPSMRSIPFTIR